jgi:hypothetical protein
MLETQSRTMYTVEEVESILRRALRRKRDSGEITYDELVETARELGIAPGELERAISEQHTLGEFEDACDEWKKSRKRKFYDHLRAYLIINGAFFLFDIFVSGGSWFYYCLLGWGIGLAFDAASAFNPDPKEIERGAKKLMRKRGRSCDTGHWAYR